MNKKKILGIVVAALIGISSIIPAFANTTDSENQASNTTQSETKESGHHKKHGKLTLAQRAEKLGVDISGLTDEQAEEKIMEARAAKLGVDITGLSKEEARAKIKKAKQDKCKRNEGQHKADCENEKDAEKNSAAQ
jgi:hypothetical protein